MQNPDIKPTKPSYATAEIVEDTICNGVRLTTLKIRYQRMVHAEMLRHRTASRCAASSRAIPIKKMVTSANATPIHWGANQVGMQAGAELTGWRLGAAQKVWATAMWFAGFFSLLMAKLGAHKQIANRLTEPFQWMEEVITGTDWDNFFNLRCHEAAQPEIFAIALTIRMELRMRKPRQVGRGADKVENWHLPFITDIERHKASKLEYDSRSELCNAIYLAKLSAARVARVSYLNHDGSKPDAAKDLGLFGRLTADPKAIHASPMEHQAYALASSGSRSRNYRGWRQFRAVIEAHEDE